MVLYSCSKGRGTKKKTKHVLSREVTRKEKVIMITEKFCTRCGKKFQAVGREVICPTCKAAAAEDSKRIAVERAKRASWNGESVPVRISGRASTIIREYGKAHDVPFAMALDALLRASAFFHSTGKTWEDITPYRSHRRDKQATETESTMKSTTATSTATTSTAATSTTETVQEAAKTMNKTSTAKKAVKTVKTAVGKAGKKS